MDPAGKDGLLDWLYLDMNSFFASVEQEKDPALRGRPVAVVPLMADTTCCIAVSYEGKAFGVKTGTKVGDARALCPGMRFVVGDHAEYVRCHKKIVRAVESCLPVDSVCSIDEIACRLAGPQRRPDAARALAASVKSAIKRDAGSTLRCSIGLAPNRYLAKVAADMRKPDGLTLILPSDLPGVLHGLELRDLPGIGRRMEERLRRLGIRDMRTLSGLGPEEMRRAWGGVRGEEMWRLLKGEELPEKGGAQKSISRSHVLPPELRHEAGASRVLKKLTVKAAARLRGEGFFASGLELFVRFLGRDAWKSRCRLAETQDTQVLLGALAGLWKGLPPGPIYAVGVVLTGLVPGSLHIPSLFEDPGRELLLKTLDDLNRKFGKDAVHYGAVHESRGLAPLRIAFTRIPEESD